MKMMFPAIFHKDDNYYWVEFPDLEGCHTQGETIEEAMEMAQEALEGYILACFDIDKPIGKPSDINAIKVSGSDIKSYVCCEVNIKPARLVKKTLSIPDWVNDIGVKQNINFSQLLTETIIKNYQMK